MTVYAITSLAFQLALPARLADLLCVHWAIEALHHLRDIAFRRGRFPGPTGTGPQVMACLRNLVIGVLSRAGPVNLAALLRHHARDPARPLPPSGSHSDETDTTERTPETSPWPSRLRAAHGACCFRGTRAATDELTRSGEAPSGHVLSPRLPWKWNAEIGAASRCGGGEARVATSEQAGRR